MTICVPTETCGIEGDYVSSYYGIGFRMNEDIECIESSGDVSAEGEDCSTKNDGCASNLVCARNVVDSSNGNLASVCIPKSYCGINGNFVSDVQGTTFAITELTHCVISTYDIFREGEDCSIGNTRC